MAQKVWKADEINERLVELSRQILPDDLTLFYVDIDAVKEQDINPRSMSQKMFSQLVDNIKDTGGLESVPLCVRVDKDIFIISGHHRFRAAREAGVKQILVLLYDELSTSRAKSKQLAHNTISGQDDPELVKRVWEMITEIEAQFEAFVDPRVLKSVPEPVSFKQVDVDVKALAKTAVIIFLASQMADFDAAVEAIMPSADVDTVYLAEREIYDAWRDALHRVRDDMDIVSIPTAVAEMARLAVEALDARAEDGNLVDG
jgi:hypothetical protein